MTSILITGGTGSFGHKLVETLLENKFWNDRFNRIVIYSRDELKQSVMAKHFNSDRLRFFLGDVRDLPRLMMAMKGCGAVVHAAALKQVPAGEYNPMEFIKTNVQGAQNVIDAAIKCEVQQVVALSTDKAVNPVNLYGATKLCSDKLFIAANNVTGNQVTRFGVVRYGNVVGSRGSVIPLFEKIAATTGQEVPFPVTDVRMTRFWITLEQGVGFVLDTLMDTSKAGRVYVPMMPSVRIVDIAEAIDPDRKIRVVGIRPGEKLYETMCSKDESYLTYQRYSGDDDPTYYVIEPIYFNPADKSALHEPVEADFEYTSGNNTHWLTVEEIREALKDGD